MRNSEFIKRLKSSFSFLIPNSALRVPHPMRYFSLDQQKILIVLAVFIFALLYFKFYFHRSLPPEETYQEVVVEILGEVQKPGIYVFKTPPILIEAVEKAGGLKENVLLDRGVFSEIMETGALINVIRETDVIPPYPPLAKGGEGGILKKEGSGGISPNIIKI